MHFSPHQHKSGGASPLGVARAACFEQLAGVFASCGALHYAKILASLKIKNGISLTPLNCALNAFTFALNDSADAFVERLVVKYRLIVVYERLQNSVKALQLHLVYSIIPPCQFSHQRRSVVSLEVIYLYKFKIPVITFLDVRI